MRGTQERARRRGLRLRLWIPVVVLVFLSPAIYSWARMAVLPSSLPLGVRSVEWLRMHHFNWLVDDVEHVYYSWKTPAKGGPQLQTLPTVGITTTPQPHHKHATPWPPRIEPGLRPAAPRRGCLEADGAGRRGQAAGPGHDLPHGDRLPADRRVRGVVRPHAHGAGLLSRPLRAAERDPARADGGSIGQRWRLLATFNSGFIYTDGLNGDALDGHVERAAQERPRDPRRLQGRPREHRQPGREARRRAAASPSRGRACR